MLNTKIHIITSIEQFANIEQKWNELHKNVNSNFYMSYDWYKHLILNAYVSNIYIIVIEYNNKIICIAPFFINFGKKYHVGKLDTLSLIGNIYSPFRSVLMLNDYKEQALDILIKYIRNCDLWKIVSLDGININDGLNDLINNKSCFSRVSVSPQYLGARMNNMHNTDQLGLRLTKKHKQNVRSSINKLNNHGHCIIVKYSNDSMIEKGINDYYSVYSESWKKNERFPDFHKKLAEYLAIKKTLRLYIMYFCENKKDTGKRENIEMLCDAHVSDIYVPIATSFLIKDNTCAYYVKTAYAEKYKIFSPGRVLLWSFSRDLICEGVSTIDFQKGDEKYKYDYVDETDKFVGIIISTKKSLRSLMQIKILNNIIPLFKNIELKL